MLRTSRGLIASAAGLLGLVVSSAVGLPHVAASTPQLSTPPSFAICPADPSQPLVEPEALQSIDAFTTSGSAYAQQLSTGAGVKVAVLADGLDPNNPNFVRPAGSHVVTAYEDFSGTGPSATTGGGLAFGAVSAIAAQGTVTYDLSSFVNPAHPLPPGCNIHVLGVAPNADVVALRVGEPGAMSVSSIVQALNYAITVAHVKVIDEPFAISEFPDATSRSVIQAANDVATAAGVTVVEAAGDGGMNGTIGSDAADPQVISTGASTEGRLDVQTATDATQFGNGQWSDDSIASSSSGGVSEQGRTVDLVAPGSANWATCSPSFSDCRNRQAQPSSLQDFGGTAESSSLTAGAAALVISAYRSTHGGHFPGPAVVKSIITGTASDLGVPPAEQGSGLLNADAATEAALTWPGATKSAPAGVRSNITLSRDQMVLAGKPGATVSGTVDVGNVGKKTLTVAVGSRRMGTPSISGQAAAFDSTTLPTFASGDGSPDAFKRLTFQVPSGTAEVVAHMAWAGTRSPTDAPMQMTLLDPNGIFAGASEPEGGATSANSAEVEVRQPTVGTWTAVMTSPAGAAGYTGTVGLEVTSTPAVPVGTVSPSTFTLKPGHHRSVTVRLKLPAVSSGDLSDALTIASSDGHRTAVGIVARPVLDPHGTHGAFSGEIVGGDGEPATPAQTLSYPVAVPSNSAGLDASVNFPDSTPGEPVEAMLIDPHGNLADLVSNNTLTAPDSEAPGHQIQAFVARPATGRWVLVIAAANPLPGNSFMQDFTGRVRLRGMTVAQKGLPTSKKTVLKPGSVHTITLKVTDEGHQPVLLGLDARSSHYATYQPVPVTGSGTVSLPASSTDEPTYSVPPDTRSFTVTAISTVHTQVEAHALGRGVDAIGNLTAASQGSVSSATATEPSAGSYLVRGLWGASLQEVGPFSDSGAPAGQSDLIASVSTLAFNPTIRSTVDDPYRDALFGTETALPIFLTPGQTTTLTAHLTVRSPRGAHVSGLLNLVTLPSQPTRSAGSLPSRATGEVVASLPFRYTVTPLPRLSIALPHAVHRGKKLVVRVTHAGKPIHGATVHFAHHTRKTNAKGKARFRVSKHAHTGKAKVHAAATGYTAATAKVIIRR